jgi:hypothetical protein
VFDIYRIYRTFKGVFVFWQIIDKLRKNKKILILKGKKFKKEKFFFLYKNLKKIAKYLNFKTIVPLTLSLLLLDHITFCEISSENPDAIHHYILKDNGELVEVTNREECLRLEKEKKMEEELIKEDESLDFKLNVLLIFFSFIIFSVLAIYFYDNFFGKDDFDAIDFNDPVQKRAFLKKHPEFKNEPIYTKYQEKWLGQEDRLKTKTNPHFIGTSVGEKGQNFDPDFVDPYNEEVKNFEDDNIYKSDRCWREPERSKEYYEQFKKKRHPKAEIPWLKTEGKGRTKNFWTGGFYDLNFGPTGNDGLTWNDFSSGPFIKIDHEPHYVEGYGNLDSFEYNAYQNLNEEEFKRYHEKYLAEIAYEKEHPQEFEAITEVERDARSASLNRRVHALHTFDIAHEKGIKAEHAVKFAEAVAKEAEAANEAAALQLSQSEGYETEIALQEAAEAAVRAESAKEAAEIALQEAADAEALAAIKGAAAHDDFNFVEADHVYFNSTYIDPFASAARDVNADNMASTATEKAIKYFSFKEAAIEEAVREIAREIARETARETLDNSSLLIAVDAATKVARDVAALATDVSTVSEFKEAVKTAKEAAKEAAEVAVKEAEAAAEAAVRAESAKEAASQLADKVGNEILDNSSVFEAAEIALGEASDVVDTTREVAKAARDAANEIFEEEAAQIALQEASYAAEAYEKAVATKEAARKTAIKIIQEVLDNSSVFNAVKEAEETAEEVAKAAREAAKAAAEAAAEATKKKI